MFKKFSLMILIVVLGFFLALLLTPPSSSKSDFTTSSFQLRPDFGKFSLYIEEYGWGARKQLIFSPVGGEVDIEKIDKERLALLIADPVFLQAEINKIGKSLVIKYLIVFLLIWIFSTIAMLLFFKRKGFFNGGQRKNVFPLFAAVFVAFLSCLALLALFSFNTERETEYFDRGAELEKLLEAKKSLERRPYFSQESFNLLYPGVKVP